MSRNPYLRAVMLGEENYDAPYLADRPYKVGHRSTLGEADSKAPPWPKQVASSSTLPLFVWRNAICSERGPVSSAIRHVLLQLSMYMDNDSLEAWPKISTLAKGTRYSERTVGKCLKEAKRLGWITVVKRREPDRQWLHNIYTGQFPRPVEV